MCIHTSPGPPHSASSPPLSSQTRQLLQQLVCITKGFLTETLSGKLVYMLKPPTWVASGTLKRCSLHTWILGFTVDSGQRAWRRVGERIADVNLTGSSSPRWRWGYGMGNTSAFYWCHFECAEIPATRSSDPLLCHFSTPITPHCSMIVHSPMWQGSVHNSCPQETFNDPINSMLRRCVALGVDTTWFSDSKIYSGLLWWAAWGTTIIMLSNQTYMHILSIKAAMRAICSITRQREGGWHQRATWKRFTDRRWISCTPSSHSQYKGHSSSEQQWF